MNLPHATDQDLVLERVKSIFKVVNELTYNRFSDSGIASSERWWLCPASLYWHAQLTCLKGLGSGIHDTPIKSLLLIASIPA